MSDNIRAGDWIFARTGAPLIDNLVEQPRDTFPHSPQLENALRHNEPPQVEASLRNYLIGVRNELRQQGATEEHTDELIAQALAHYFDADALTDVNTPLGKVVAKYVKANISQRAAALRTTYNQNRPRH